MAHPGWSWDWPQPSSGAATTQGGPGSGTTKPQPGCPMTARRTTHASREPTEPCRAARRGQGCAPTTRGALAALHAVRADLVESRVLLGLARCAMAHRLQDVYTGRPKTRPRCHRLSPCVV